MDDKTRYKVQQVTGYDFTYDHYINLFILFVPVSLIVKYILQRYLLKLSHNVGNELSAIKFDEWVTEAMLSPDENYTKLQNNFSILNRRIVNSVIYPYFVFVSNSLQFIALFVLMLTIDWKICLFGSLIYSLVYGLTFTIIKGKLVVLGEKFISDNKALISILIEAFSLQYLFRLTKKNTIQHRYSSHDMYVRNSIINLNLLSSIPKYVIEGLICFIIAIYLYISYNKIYDLEFSTVISFSYILLRMLPLSQAIVGAVSNLVSSQPTILEFNTDNKKVPLVNYLKINYIANTSELLSNFFSNKFEKKMLCFVSGESGCGKSQFLKSLAYNSHLSDHFFYDDSTNFKNTFQLTTDSFVYLDDQCISSDLYVNSLLNLFDLKLDQNTLKIFELNSVFEKNQPYKTLSHGEKQRISLLVFAQIKNKYIVFDESLSGIDLRLKLKIINHFVNNCNKVILVDHGLNPSNLTPSTTCPLVLIECK